MTALFQAASALAEAETEESEMRVLVAAREHLDMDVSYCSHLATVEQVIQRVHGDARSFGLQPGRAMHPSAAAAELRDNAGTQFDADVVAALLRIVER